MRIFEAADYLPVRIIRWLFTVKIVEIKKTRCRELPMIKYKKSARFQENIRMYRIDSKP
jgi:hypothetical protein